MNMNNKVLDLKSDLAIELAVLEQLREGLAGIGTRLGRKGAALGVAKLFADLTLELEPKSGVSASMPTEVRRSVDRYTILNYSQTLGREGQKIENPMVLTRFISPKLGEQLRGLGVNFADAAGNVSIVLPASNFYFHVRAVAKDPFREAGRPLKNLSGEASALVVRGLADLGVPIKVSELIEQTGVSRASAYRTLDFAEQAGFLQRAAPGIVTSFELAEALEEIAGSFGFTKRGLIRRYVAPRGLDTVVEYLRTARTPYALTGSYATAGLKQVSVATSLFIYSDDPAALANELGLSEVDSGGDVFINIPEWRLVYQRLRQHESLTTVSAAQIAIDLLGGPGRNPEEGRALIEWLGQQQSR